MDLNKPSNTVVCVVMEKIKYQINITAVDNITLNKNNSPIYPLSVLTMQNNSANEIVYGETIYKEAQKTLNNNIKIGDVFTLKFVNNNGFKIGVSTKVNQKPQNMVSNFVELNYSVDESFIETYVEEVESATDTLHVINVYLFADYESYTFTYKIDKRSDGANNSVIMANIFATKTDKITDETETVTETKTDENGAKYITFEGLKLYDVVTLYATPLEYQETYYLFDRFTPNGVTRLSVTSTPDVIYPEIITYSHEHIISANETVAVIFAPPKVQLTVGITDETIYSLENVNIYQTLLDDETGEEAEKKLELIDGAYNVQAGEVRVELTNLDTVKYGYYYKECLVSFIGASEQDVETLNGESFVFTLTNSVPYEIEIVCPEVVFEVYIKQHGQEILTDGEYVQFGENNYTELTISNSILSFDLPGNGGIYVADARFGGKILESFAQDDDATTLIYEKTLTEDDFKLFYDVANIDRMIITLDFNYEITKYDIVINLVNNSVKLNGYQDLTEQVNLTITSDYTKEIEVNKITFKNIPYNSSNITITADVPSSTGLIAEYWKNSSIGIFSQTTYSITFQPITATGEVDYFLTYIQYTVKLEYNQAQGAPQVNDNLKANISVGDVISIKTNAFGTSGYQFKNLYQMYVYNANSWEKVKSSVYYKDGQELIKNNNPEYDNTKTYYVLMQTLDYEKTSYLDESFVPSNYYINGAEIKILVVYDYIKIIISNESKMSAKGVNIKHPDTQQEIPVSSFASYSMFVEDELINSDSVFTVADGMLKIIVNMNNISCNINEQVVDINLSKGVNLDNVKAYGLDFKWTPELSGESYTLFIDVSLLLSKMVDANLISYEDEYSVLKLEYSYSISKIKVQMTTNIPTSPYQPSSFYTDQDASSNRLFTMESVSGFMSETNSKDTGYLTENQKFLSKTNFKYTFINPFTQYFKISTYKVYYTPNENSALTDANLIMPEDYAKHGICELKSGDNFTLDVRYVSRITIMLIVETKINFSSSWEGNEITKPVKYNSETGVIENQKLNIGYNSETDDIFMAQFIYEQAKVEQNVKYYDIVSGELKLNGPSTVGKYSVIITFTGEGNYAWLSQITMPYNIYFNISPLDLIVDNSATIETYEKTYNQTSAVELKNVVGNLILSGVSSSGEIFVISMAESNKFKLICTSAYTCDTEGIAVINASDELYRVKVEGLELDTNIDFLKNFKLDKKEIIMPVCVKVNKEAITLSNLEFYDKVYDGTTSVELIDKSFVKLLGVKAGDEVSIDFDKLKMEFEDAEIGANKNVLINTDECLDGFHAVNYYITLSTVVQKPSIFPYKLTKDVEGFGKIELINEKGLTDKTQVSLIPIGAQLQVDVIKDGTPEYVAIYSYISRFLTGNRVFAVGYKLSLNINGEKRAPSNQLYLSVPSTNKLMGVVSLSGEESLELRYSEEESRVLVDLSQIKTNVSHIILTKQRILLELWQIILVVSIAVVVVGGIAITIIVIRKKKLKKYSINEKI